MTAKSDRKYENQTDKTCGKNQRSSDTAKPIPDGCYESGATNEKLQEEPSDSASLSTDLQGNGYPRSAKFDDQKEEFSTSV